MAISHFSPTLLQLLATTFLLSAFLAILDTFLLKAKWYPIVHVYHISFIHLSMYRYLGCFHPLAIVNIMLLWTWVYKYPFKTPFSILLGLLDYLVIIFSILWATTKPWFSQQLHYFTFPPIVHKNFNFSTSSLTLVLFFCSLPFF